MNTHLVSCTLKQPLCVPVGMDLSKSLISSDTLWGTVCWMIRRSLGERQLIALLREFDQPRKPFVVSSVFLSRESMPLVPCSASQEGKWLNLETGQFEHRADCYEVSPLHRTSISRESGVGMGHETDKHLISLKEGVRLCFWVVTRDDCTNTVLNALRFLEKTGSLGGKASLGYGSIEELFIEPYALPKPTNRFLTLSATARSTFGPDRWRPMSGTTRRLGGYTWGDTAPKQPTEVWEEGSIFASSQSGEIDLLGLLDVTPEGAEHPVFRMCYPFPFYLGGRLDP